MYEHLQDSNSVQQAFRRLSSGKDRAKANAVEHGSDQEEDSGEYGNNQHHQHQRDEETKTQHRNSGGGDIRGRRPPSGGGEAAAMWSQSADILSDTLGEDGVISGGFVHSVW